jgi:hypothetical protein
MAPIVELTFTPAAAVAAARAAPLSAKKALLAALLVDAAADALFAQTHGGDGDILAFRAGLAARSEPLALVFGIAAQKLMLVTEAVEVPVAEYPTLGVEDFMVSLYNGRTVQRVRVALPDGGRADVHDVLVAALAALG